MGLFSGIFKGNGNSKSSSKGISNPLKGVLSGKGRTPWFKGSVNRNRNKQRKGGYAGGWAAIAFSNIVNAHSSGDEIVETWELAKENNSYCTAYEDSYKEQYDIADAIYKENCEYILSVIESLTVEMELDIEEAEQLESQAQELQDEAEGLMEDAEFCDPEELIEILEEAEALKAEAQELMEQAEVLRTMAAELQIEIDMQYSEMEMLTIEEFIDYDEVENNANLYALEFAQDWIDGSVWIPSEVLDWAFYELSSHNG